MKIQLIPFSAILIPSIIFFMDESKQSENNKTMMGVIPDKKGNCSKGICKQSCIDKAMVESTKIVENKFSLDTFDLEELCFEKRRQFLYFIMQG